MSKTVTPEVLWAQRSSTSDAEKNYLLLTISIPNCVPEPTVVIEANSIGIKAKSSSNTDETFELHIDLLKEIVPETSLHKIANGQHYFMKLFKKDLELEYWPRLTKEKIKYNNIKTDFNKWVDEDEQETVAAQDDQMANNMFGGAGGAGGAGGMPDMSGIDMEALQQMLAQGGGAGMGME